MMKILGSPVPKISGATWEIGLSKAFQHVWVKPKIVPKEMLWSVNVLLYYQVLNNIKQKWNEFHDIKQRVFVSKDEISSLC